MPPRATLPAADAHNSTTVAFVSFVGRWRITFGPPGTLQRKKARREGREEDFPPYSSKEFRVSANFEVSVSLSLFLLEKGVDVDV